MRIIVCAVALGIGLSFLVASPAHAWRINENAEVYGYSQVWATIWEQMEDARGAFQSPSGDEATDTLTGFSLRRARLGARVSVPDKTIGAFVQIKLEREVSILDLAARFALRPWLVIDVGQFKVPGTGETLTEDRVLDFILRTQLSDAIADYALSRTAHPASLLYATTSNQRDLGIGLRGELQHRWLKPRWFLMVGNGLGANLYFGGATRKEYFITNRPQFLWAGRLELADIAGFVTLGAHASWNRHDDMLFNSGRVVYDLNRRAGSLDVKAALPGIGLRVYGLAGRGEVRDDFNGDGRTDLRYSGWAAAITWDVLPAARRSSGRSLGGEATLELGARFDRYVSEMDESGSSVRKDNWTVGVATRLPEHLKLQLNYVLRRTDDPSRPDLADNILFANFQVEF